MRIACMLIALATTLLPNVARAQVNYVLLPGYFGSVNTGFVWLATVVSYKDATVYQCHALLPSAGGNMSLTCGPQSFPGTILTGANVVTMRPLIPPARQDPVGDLWQLDQQAGLLQLCSTQGTNPGCASFQLP
jgi:hypothetical protein